MSNTSENIRKLSENISNADTSDAIAIAIVESVEGQNQHYVTKQELDYAIHKVESKIKTQIILALLAIFSGIILLFFETPIKKLFP